MPTDLIEAILALGNTLPSLPVNAVHEAGRQQLTQTLDCLTPALELASSHALERFDAVSNAKYASASARLSGLTQSLGVRQISEHQSLVALAEVIRLSVQKLYERKLEPTDAGKLLVWVKSARAALQAN